MITVPREDVIIMLEAGYIYMAMKRFKEAKAVFEGICALFPKHDVPMVSLANVYFSQCKFLEAIRVLKKTLKDNPNSVFALAHLGEAQLFRGKREEAAENLQKASKLEPTKEGKSGEFARSLLELMKLGYDPVQLRKDFKQYIQDRNKEQAASK